MTIQRIVVRNSKGVPLSLSQSIEDPESVAPAGSMDNGTVEALEDGMFGNAPDGHLSIPQLIKVLQYFEDYSTTPAQAQYEYEMEEFGECEWHEGMDDRDHLDEMISADEDKQQFGKGW